MMEPCSSTAKHDPHHYMHESNGYWCEGKPDRPARDPGDSMTESTSPEIDAKVNAFVLAGFRSHGDWRDDPSEKHLRRCDSARVESHEMSNGTYGCDTGCEYATLEAEITCDHGEQASHEYGTFGEVGDILEEIEAMS